MAEVQCQACGRSWPEGPAFCGGCGRPLGPPETDLFKHYLAGGTQHHQVACRKFGSGARCSPETVLTFAAPAHCCARRTGLQERGRADKRRLPLRS
jgi:hypothetical protein